MRYFIKETTTSTFLLKDDSKWYGYVDSNLNIQEDSVNYGDLKNYTQEITLSIPLTDPSVNLSGDKVFILGILWPKIKGSYPYGNARDDYQYWGDLNVTISGDSQEYNLTRAITGNDFLNTYTETIELCDSSSYNYANTPYVLTSANEYLPVDSWDRMDDSTVDLTLDEHIITDRFKLYGDTRQTISADLRINEVLRPFKKFVDETQNKEYLLTSYSYLPAKGVYKNAILMEYDISTNINFS